MIRKHNKIQKGFALVENLVAIALLGISIVGATSLFISSFHTNSASRTYTAVIGDVHSIIDGYRTTSFSTLLGKFNTAFDGITNGQVAAETSTSIPARATYTTTFTAIKTSTTNIPEAVKIQVQAVQRRGQFDDATYRFETIIAQTN